jgi:hypothetical protein
MADRPDYVHCVALGYVEKDEDGNRNPEWGISWCGRNIRSEFHFIDPAHALLNARRGGRLLICPECATAMLETIKNGTYEDDGSDECDDGSDECDSSDEFDEEILSSEFDEDPVDGAID